MSYASDGCNCLKVAFFFLAFFCHKGTIVSYLIPHLTLFSYLSLTLLHLSFISFSLFETITSLMGFRPGHPELH